MKAMKESATYQAILEEGRAIGWEKGYAIGMARTWEKGYAEGRILGAKRILIRLGRLRFGPLPRTLQRKLKAIADMEKLYEMVDRLLVVSTWDEFIGD
jgi:predicted transposase YdaD